MRVIVLCVLLVCASLLSAVERMQSQSWKLAAATTTFTLSADPAPATEVLLFRNGFMMTEQEDYNLVGRVITFAPTQTPQTGDVIKVVYWVSVI